MDDDKIEANAAPEEPVMKQQILSTIAAVLLLAPAALATTMNSPNYSSNAGRVVSGGSAATDASGMNKAGIAIGQAIFIPSVPPVSPSFSAKTVVLASEDIAVPPLVVSTLPDGATTAASSLTVSGRVSTTPLPKSLTINGIPVNINPDGSYTVSVPLTQGNNSITIVSTSQSGAVTTRIRTVTYSPVAPPISVTSIANNSTIPLSQTTLPLSGTVGANVTAVIVSVNGGTPQTVTVANGAFSTALDTLVSVMNTIVITTVNATGSSSSSAITVWRSSAASALAHTGDINGDNMVDIVDALLALKSGVGLVQLSSSEISRGDVGPLVNGVAVGDGRIDIEDTILILRKAVGLIW